MDGVLSAQMMQHGLQKQGESRMAAATSRMMSLRAGGKPDPQKVREAAEDFEAVFISQMLTHMFAGVETNEVFGGGHAEDVYKTMMIDEYGKIMAKAGGIGVADHVTQQLLQTQQNANEHGLSMMHAAKHYSQAQAVDPHTPREVTMTQGVEHE